MKACKLNNHRTDFDTATNILTSAKTAHLLLLCNNINSNFVVSFCVIARFKILREHHDKLTENTDQ